MTAGVREDLRIESDSRKHYYFEVTVPFRAAGCVVSFGLANDKAKLDFPSSFGLGVGVDKNSWGLSTNGDLCHEGVIAWN